jgi:protein-tyrosine phosphatase
MIYALGQPTLGAIDDVVKRVRSMHPHAERMVWITLREEPIVYINGAPYCLRREGSSLRNMKGIPIAPMTLVICAEMTGSDYGGISASRLEILEERLREDVISELGAFGGRYECLSLLFFIVIFKHYEPSILLHTETPDGSVVPVWEDVQNNDVQVLKDIMASRNASDDGFELCYYRIPLTAERPPDFTDLSELIDLVVRFDSTHTPMVVNCQLGRGRSTLTSVSDLGDVYGVKLTMQLLLDHSALDQAVVGGQQTNVSDSPEETNVVYGTQNRLQFRGAPTETSLLPSHQ